MARILMADDQQFIADLMKESLTEQTGHDVKVVPSYDAVKETIAESGPFDLILLDYEMPGQNGLEGITEIVALNQGKPVAVFSGALPAHVESSMAKSGISGYLPKSAPLRSLSASIEFLLAGEVYFPPDWIRKVNEKKAVALNNTLQAVLDGICDGLTNREIGDLHGITEPNVKRYVRQVMELIGAKNRTHAAVIALNKGLLSKTTSKQP